MKRFTTEQLRTFAAAIEHGTFDEAALELGVTASAVSQRIKGMEQACGQILLRRSNPVEATAPGQTVLRLARQVEELARDAEEELVGGAGGRRLAVASNADSLSTWFLEALAALDPAAGIHCEVLREDERHASTLLRSGRVMAVLTSDPRPVQGCTVERLGTMRYWAVVAPGLAERCFPGLGPASGRDDLGPRALVGRLGSAQLDAAPVLQYDRKDDQMLDDLIRRVARAHGTRGGLEAPRVHIPGSAEYFRAAELGLGWGAVPEQQCAGALAQGRLVRLMDEPFDMPMFWQRWSLSSPALDALTEAVRATAHEALLPIDHD